MVKKTILRQTGDNDTILVYAIVSHDSDLQVCLQLNRTLNINLTLGEDFELWLKEEKVLFRRYHFENEEILEKFQLFVNRSGGYFLFPELKKIDYVLVIHTEANPRSIEEHLRELRETKVFTALTKVSNASLRSLDRIIL